MRARPHSLLDFQYIRRLSVLTDIHSAALIPTEGFCRHSPCQGGWNKEKWQSVTYSFRHAGACCQG